MSFNIPRLLRHRLSTSSKSILLLGPRQVGKSTLIESLKPELTVNLAQQSEFLAFTSNPSELEERIAQEKPKTIFIDEIQRIPELLNSIQALVDKNKSLKFYLSGSSARKLKRGSANLLPGRLLVYRLGPLCSAELDYEMNTNCAMSVGTLPEPYTSERALAEKILESYTATYLQEEILQETLLRQIQGFSRFLAVVAQNSGQFLDLSKIASKAKVNRSAARRYFEILEDTLICDRVDSFAESPQASGFDLVKHPKYYLFDVGVVNASFGNFTASTDRKGLLFEHLFYNQLRNTAFALDTKVSIFHFRTRGGLEIDFIITKGKDLYAIELKSGGVENSSLSGLRSFSETMRSKVKCYVATIGERKRRVGDIAILPWQAVMKEIFEN